MLIVLRDQSANALLKTLEEPPSTSNVILLTARVDALLPTVRSRSQHLSFAPLSLTEMEKYIASQQGRSKTDGALLARIAEGSIGRLAATDLSDYRRERRELMEIVELLASGGRRYRLVKAAEYIGKLDRDIFEKKLDLLMRILRDMVLLVSGRDPDQIVNIDEAEKLQLLASRIGWDRLTVWIEGFNELRLNLVVNINRQIAMDGLLQRLAS
jgi:DNA polymerase-3 subunit delta'